MKYSVVVPYKNAAEWIQRCADSCRTQSGDFEFIFVNDHSSDDPVFETDDRFILVDNKYKTGVSGARNTGLDIASGDWITFLDADDILIPNAYKLFTDAINKADGFNILQFNHYRYYAKINKTALKHKNNAGVYPLERLPLCWCYIWNKLYKAEIVKDIRFNETMRFGEDELFNVECLSKEKRIRCFDSVSMTHTFENRQSLSKAKTEADIFEMLRVYEDYIKKHNDLELRRALCLRLSTLWSHLFLDELTGKR